MSQCQFCLTVQPNDKPEPEKLSTWLENKMVDCCLFGAVQLTNWPRSKRMAWMTTKGQHRSSWICYSWAAYPTRCQWQCHLLQQANKHSVCMRMYWVEQHVLPLNSTAGVINCALAPNTASPLGRIKFDLLQLEHLPRHACSIVQRGEHLHCFCCTQSKVCATISFVDSKLTFDKTQTQKIHVWRVEKLNLKLGTFVPNWIGPVRNIMAWV